MILPTCDTIGLMDEHQQHHEHHEEHHDPNEHQEHHDNGTSGHGDDSPSHDSGESQHDSGAAQHNHDATRDEAVVTESEWEPPARTEAHNVDVIDTRNQFRNSGINISKRSIYRLCRPGRKGNTRLECGVDEFDRKFYVTQPSIDRTIEDLVNKRNRYRSEHDNDTTQNDNDMSWQDNGMTRQNSDTPHHDSDVSQGNELAQHGTEPVGDGSAEELAQKDEKIKGLEEELNKKKEDYDNLIREKIEFEKATEYKDKMITMAEGRIQQDREDYNNRMGFLQDQILKLQEKGDTYVQQLLDTKEKVGSLEAQVRQLEAPKTEDGTHNVQEENNNPNEGDHNQGEEHRHNEGDNQQHHEHHEEHHDNNNHEERHGN